jgi:gliding motility-associated-like protein
MPNAFTPNRDGRNDLFRASYKGYFEAFQLSIYNRWGQVVYSSSNPDQGWNGRLGGKDIDSGVFVWICTYRFFGRTTSTQKGTVTLIR